MGTGAETDREVLERLTRIEVKLDAAISRADDHENRLRRLERTVWAVAGAAAIAGGAVSGGLLRVLGG